MAAMSAAGVGSLICALSQHNEKADVARARYPSARIARLVAQLQQASLYRHQYPHMRRRARPECGEIVAALKGRDHSALGVPAGNLQQLLTHPGVIGFVEQQLRERVALMRVEPGRDYDQLGSERVERRQDLAAEAEAELARAGHRRQRHIDDVADPG